MATQDIPHKNQLRKLYLAHLADFEHTLAEFQGKVRQLLEQEQLTAAIKYRVKRFEAYYDKLRRQLRARKPATEITDLFGIRIVCPFLADIDAIADLLESRFENLEIERKAHRHSFREFGYDSVHMLLRIPNPEHQTPLPGTSQVCEVQLRTILQDAWAEVEHELVYKSDLSMPNDSIRRKLAALNATLTLSDLTFQEIRDYQQHLRQRKQKRRDLTDSSWLLAELAGSSEAEQIQGEDGPRLAPMPKTVTNDLERLMLHALEAHSNGDFYAAIQFYGELLGMRLQRKIRSLVYNHRGMAWFALGEVRKARRDFSQALRFDPENIRGYTNRGLCHRILLQHDQALGDYGQALELDSEDADSYFGRAQGFFEMGLTEQALKDCQAALRLRPDFPPASQLAKLLQQNQF